MDKKYLFSIFFLVFNAKSIALPVIYFQPETFEQANPYLAAMAYRNNVIQNQLRNQYRHNAYMQTDYTENSQVIESYISGEFEGWSGDTIFELGNGQVWKQSSYAYYYYYAYHPKVLIYQGDGCYKMKVENIDQTICVERLR